MKKSTNKKANKTIVAKKQRKQASSELYVARLRELARTAQLASEAHRSVLDVLRGEPAISNSDVTAYLDSAATSAHNTLTFLQKAIQSKWNNK